MKHFKLIAIILVVAWLLILTFLFASHSNTSDQDNNTQTEQQN